MDDVEIGLTIIIASLFLLAGLVVRAYGTTRHDDPLGIARSVGVLVDRRDPELHGEFVDELAARRDAEGGAR